MCTAALHHLHIVRSLRPLLAPLQSLLPWINIGLKGLRFEIHGVPVDR